MAEFRTRRPRHICETARHRDWRRLVCHVWTAPSWQELSSRLQHWSVQPCVRPFDAVHMTAGHNALRGSGPGQNLAFDNAVAHVGCPDRRIDRLCITRCSLLQPSHYAGCPARSRLQRDGLPITLALSHHGPGHSGKLVGKRDGGDLGRSPGQQCREPGAVFGAVDLGIADDGECTGGLLMAAWSIMSRSPTGRPRSRHDRMALNREFSDRMLMSVRPPVRKFLGCDGISNRSRDS